MTQRSDLYNLENTQAIVDTQKAALVELELKLKEAYEKEGIHSYYQDYITFPFIRPDNLDELTKEVETLEAKCSPETLKLIEDRRQLRQQGFARNRSAEEYVIDLLSKDFTDQLVEGCKGEAKTVYQVDDSYYRMLLPDDISLEDAARVREADWKFKSVMVRAASEALQEVNPAHFAREYATYSFFSNIGTDTDVGVGFSNNPSGITIPSPILESPKLADIKADLDFRLRMASVDLNEMLSDAFKDALKD